MKAGRRIKREQRYQLNLIYRMAENLVVLQGIDVIKALHLILGMLEWKKGDKKPN